MLNATAFEFKKITVRKKFTFGIIFEAVVIALIMAALNFANTKIREDANIFLTLPDVYPLVLRAYSDVILPLKIFALTSDLISHEWGSQTIKNILLRPATRFAVYSGKVLAIFIYAAINLLIAFGVCFILSFIFFTKAQNHFTAFLSYFFTLLPVAVVISFSAFISGLSKSSIASMTILIATYIGMSAASLFSSAFASVAFTNYLGFYKFLFSSGLPFFNALNAFAFLISTGAAFFILGFLLFNSRDA
jgi:ABC-2 type transport system permease protein